MLQVDKATFVSIVLCAFVICTAGYLYLNTPPDFKILSGILYTFNLSIAKYCYPSNNIHSILKILYTSFYIRVRKAKITLLWGWGWWATPKGPSPEALEAAQRAALKAQEAAKRLEEERIWCSKSIWEQFRENNPIEDLLQSGSFSALRTNRFLTHNLYPYLPEWESYRTMVEYHMGVAEIVLYLIAVAGLVILRLADELSLRDAAKTLLCTRALGNRIRTIDWVENSRLVLFLLLQYAVARVGQLYLFIALMPSIGASKANYFFPPNWLHAVRTLVRDDPTAVRSAAVALVLFLIVGRIVLCVLSHVKRQIRPASAKEWAPHTSAEKDRYTSEQPRWENLTPADIYATIDIVRGWTINPIRLALKYVRWARGRGWKWGVPPLLLSGLRDLFGAMGYIVGNIFDTLWYWYVVFPKHDPYRPHTVKEYFMMFGPIFLPFPVWLLYAYYKSKGG